MPLRNGLGRQRNLNHTWAIVDYEVSKATQAVQDVAILAFIAYSVRDDILFGGPNWFGQKGLEGEGATEG